MVKPDGVQRGLVSFTILFNVVKNFVIALLLRKEIYLKSQLFV